MTRGREDHATKTMHDGRGSSASVPSSDVDPLVIYGDNRNGGYRSVTKTNA